ncbi:MAG: alpha-hydroxy-acid oxidizing protein [Actinobacteria bacterium]|nr:alpha-hydroxy-acid oxidizing protein [Actinomycetota bacterium]
MPEGWVNVFDVQREAERKLEPGPRGYFSGGAGDEVTLRESVAAWQGWRLRPRMLTGVEAPSTAAELLDKPLPAPLLVAPVAYQRMLHPEGEEAMARAAAAVGTVMCLSTLANATPADVAAAAPGGRRWFQLYPFRDGGVTRALMAEAVGAGFEAVVLTVDAPPGGNRERDVRSGFTIPAAVEIPSVAAALGGSRTVTVAETFDLMNLTLTWDDVAGIAADAGVPLFVKGIVTAEDAALALAHGVTGIIVSNHGGRQLDRCVTTAEALPEIVEAVARRAPVLVDGGIRRGVDICVALALGADAVLVGRPTAWGLAAGGAAGAEWVLRTLTRELELALALIGVATPAELGPEHLRSAGPTRVYSGAEVSGSSSF